MPPNKTPTNTIDLCLRTPDPDPWFTDLEEDAWQELERLRRIREKNLRDMAAWNAAADFVSQNADQLGKLSLREAFEKGFLAGYDCAKIENT